MRSFLVPLSDKNDAPHITYLQAWSFQIVRSTEHISSPTTDGSRSFIIDFDALALQGIGLRQACADTDFLYSLFCDARRHQIDVPGFNRAIMENLLAMQYRAQIASYRARYPDADRFIIEHSSVPIGQMLISNSDSKRMHLVDITLLSEWRSRGIGTVIIRALQSAAAYRSTALNLSVACDSPALALYQRLDFKETSRGDVYVSMIWEGQNGSD